MPKDATKNVDRYKIRGGTLNEFEFSENQEQLTEDHKGKSNRKLIPGTPPEKKTKKKATKKPAEARGASAKKLAARKAAKKK
jgi:hypothetical protein